MLQAQPAESTASFSKDDVKLLAIPPSEVGRVWRIAQEQLALAVSWSRKVDLAEMRERLASGFGQLWMVWAPQQERVLCTFVVELIEYPSGWKTARVVLLGGGSLESWRHLLGDVEAWARAEGCHAVEIVGRKGWQRVFPDYEHCETVIAKELA